MSEPHPPSLPALLDEIRAEFPRFRIVRKDQSPLQRAIHGILVVLTCGAQRSYLTCYHTTIGMTVYVTPDWDDLPDLQRVITLRHERVHLRQFRRYGLPLMAVLYLLLPLPVGLAWFRAYFEKQAYAETLRATAEIYGPEAARSPALREHIVQQFTSGSYGWMWPFRRSVTAWVERVAEETASAARSQAG